ncbi:MAG: RodZ domain-containing protein [Solirubrobacteraceae bacterium]
MAEIGARLREARMHAKIDINEVEVSTKIRAKYLRAIENEEWDLLPGEIYAKSFLRTYGEFLGLDTRQLLDDFRRRYENPADQELRPIAPLGSRERERQSRGPLIPPWLIVGVVLIIIVVTLYVVGKSATSNTPTPTHAVVTQPAHPARRHRGTTPRRTVAGTVKLQLVPTGQVYVCLVNARGKVLIPGLIYNVGQTIPVKTAPKLLLTLGNNAVTMKVNGKAMPIAASSGSIGYELLPGSSRRLPTAKQPRCA